jgi:putative endonuclease
MWYVYVLLCWDGSLYTGIATDVERRFQEHRAGRGARYTKAHPPRKIVYQEPAGSRSEALKREHQIKSWTRGKKLKTLSIDPHQA